MRCQAILKLALAVGIILILPSCLSSKHMRAQEIQTDIALREMRSELEDQKYALSRLKVELEIIEGKSDSQVSSIRQMRGDLSKFSRSEKEFYQNTWVQYEAKLKELLQCEASLKQDLQTLKKDSQDVLSTLAQFKSKIDENEQVILKQSQDIDHLQSSLVTLLNTVDGPVDGQMFYIVQSGDTLKKIAQDNQLSEDDVRRLNHLSSDLLIIGQKLRLK